MMRLKLRLCSCDNKCSNNSNISDVITREDDDRLAPQIDDLSSGNGDITDKTVKPAIHTHLAPDDPELSNRSEFMLIKTHHCFFYWLFVLLNR